MGFGLAVEELSVQNLGFRVRGLRFRDMASSSGIKVEG